MERLEASRRGAEAALAEVRGAVRREVGLVPRAFGLVLPLTAFSVGLVLAKRWLRRRRRGS